MYEKSVFFNYRKLMNKHDDFLAPTGAQGVKMSFVCASVRDIPQMSTERALREQASKKSEPCPLGACYHCIAVCRDIAAQCSLTIC